MVKADSSWVGLAMQVGAPVFFCGDDVRTRIERRRDGGCKRNTQTGAGFTVPPTTYSLVAHTNSHNVPWPKYVGYYPILCESMLRSLPGMLRAIQHTKDENVQNKEHKNIVDATALRTR